MNEIEYIRAYQNSWQHLEDELAMLDLLLQLRVLDLRQPQADELQDTFKGLYLSDQEIDDLRFCIMAVDESDCLVLVDYTDDGTSATLWAASVAGTEMTATEAQAWGATVASGFDINDYKIIRI